MQVNVKVLKLEPENILKILKYSKIISILKDAKENSKIIFYFMNNGKFKIIVPTVYSIGEFIFDYQIKDELILLDNLNEEDILFDANYENSIFNIDFDKFLDALKKLTDLKKPCLMFFNKNKTLLTMKTPDNSSIISISIVLKDFELEKKDSKSFINFFEQDFKNQFFKNIYLNEDVIKFAKISFSASKNTTNNTGIGIYNNYLKYADRLLIFSQPFKNSFLKEGECFILRKDILNLILPILNIENEPGINIYYKNGDNKDSSDSFYYENKEKDIKIFCLLRSIEIVLPSDEEIDNIIPKLHDDNILLKIDFNLFKSSLDFFSGLFETGFLKLVNFKYFIYERKLLLYYNHHLISAKTQIDEFNEIFFNLKNSSISEIEYILPCDIILNIFNSLSINNEENLEVIINFNDKNTNEAHGVGVEIIIKEKNKDEIIYDIILAKLIS